MSYSIFKLLTILNSLQLAGSKNVSYVILTYLLRGNIIAPYPGFLPEESVLCGVAHCLDLTFWPYVHTTELLLKSVLTLNFKLREIPS
jgi:hypothetical protein